MLADNAQLIWTGLLQTVYMSGIALIVSYVIGLPLGIALVTTEKGHILPNTPFNKILGAIVNITRSIPFIILLFAVIPFTRIVVGTSIGTMAATVPLTIAAIPFVARIVESSLKEIDWGIVEAAVAMGASPLQIVFRVLLPEAIPSLLLGATITAITLISYSAMAGVVGGGGLGDIAVRYGYYRYETQTMLVTVAILVVIVQLVQSLGNFLSQKLNKK